jgi:hypothetical protein
VAYFCDPEAKLPPNLGQLLKDVGFPKHTLLPESYLQDFKVKLIGGRISVTVSIVIHLFGHFQLAYDTSIAACCFIHYLKFYIITMQREGKFILQIYLCKV